MTARLAFTRILASVLLAACASDHESDSAVQNVDTAVQSAFVGVSGGQLYYEVPGSGDDDFECD